MARVSKNQVAAPEMSAAGNFEIDDSMQEAPMHIIDNSPKEEETHGHKVSFKEEPELINCLRNERVIVRHIYKPTYMVPHKGHVLDGGMADNATKSFVVPIIQSTGVYKNVLTNSEKAFLEHVMGLEPGALGIYKQHDNFWDDSNPNGIGRVTLHKYDTYLDLSVPADYIKYKILLANKDEIAPSMQEYEDRPKATYKYVIISENAETQLNLGKMEVTKRCYIEYGKIENDFDTLRVLIELIDGRPVSPKVKLDYLQGKVNEYIQRNARQFLSAIKDELLPAKVLIKRCTEAGLVYKKNDAYYLKDGNIPMCGVNEESTLNNAAKYLLNVKNQQLKYSLEAKLKEE